MNDYIHYKLWDEITYPFPNFNGTNVVVCEWTSNLIPHMGIWLLIHAGTSLQNKIWNLLDRSAILPKFIYDKEGKIDGPTQILPVIVRGPAVILKIIWD